MKKLLLAAALFALGLIPARSADAPPPQDEAGRIAAARKLADGLKYQEGEITLRGGIAKIALPAGFRYLDPSNSETLLHKLWGNPGGGGTLGIITPKGFDPLADESWAVVLSFTEDGYVKDDDAAKINYDDLMKDMKKDTLEANKQREKEGYSSIELIGWAAPPHYDQATHKMYWAKEIKFGDSPEHTLNYNIRMLGRRGVLVVNAVGSMGQLKQIEAATPQLLGMVNFQEGHRYADFSASTDKVATYGLAALVAGGVAAKVGLFKGIWLAVLALKKFVVIGIIALVAGIKKLFSGRKDSAGLRNDSASLPPPNSPPAA